MERAVVSGRGRGRGRDLDLDLEVIGAAAADVCILLTGPSRAALELARRIHRLRGVRPGRFKAVHGGWPESLLDEQLFHGLRPGSSGTLFIDEVGRLGPEFQDRLLHTLDGTAYPGGPRLARARVMAGTSEALLQRALEGSFNERLLYRLNAIHLVVPPDDSEW